MSVLTPANAARTHNTLRMGTTLFDFLRASCSRCWLDDLESRLRERGYMTGDGHVMRDALVRDFSALYSAGFEDARLEAWLGSGGPVAHVLLRLRHPMRSPHPVEVALLRNALDEIEFTSSPAPPKAGASRRTHPPDNAAVPAAEQTAAQLSPATATDRATRRHGPGQSAMETTRARGRNRRADSTSTPNRQ
jgi:hypothetical protein